MTALVGDFLTHNPQPRTVSEHQRQAFRLTFEESDLLLNEIAEKDCPVILPLASLVCVKLSLRVPMVERPLNRNPTTISKAQLRGPRIEAYLADFQPHKEL